MVRIKGFMAGIVAAVVAAAGIQNSYAVAIVSVLNISDTGSLKTEAVGPPASTSTNAVANPYGSGSMVITPVGTTGFKLSFSPNAGFFASANNLSGGKTSTFAGQLSFDITFDGAVNLTANVFEDGIYSVSGANSRVSPAPSDGASGIIVTELTSGTNQKISSVFLSLNSPLITPPPTGPGHSFLSGSGVWTLFGKATGFAQSYTKYHVAIDNDLIAEALINPNQAPGFAAIAKKDFSIVFTFDGSSGGGPDVPEPASLGVLALGGLALLARRRK